MKLKIIEQKENPVFNRKELILETESFISPKNTEILKMILQDFSVPEENIKIKGIYGKFGTHIFKIYANIYGTLKDKEETEIKTKKEREAERKLIEENARGIGEEEKKPKEE